jgi:TonB family protein
MKRIPNKSGRRLLLLGTLLATGLAFTGYFRYRTKSLFASDTRLATPKPPLSLQPSRFPCLDSLADRRGRKRVVVLHGADWTLDSSVELKCFPEREVVLSVEVGRGFLHHPITQRIRFWITKKGDVTYAKIVESNGSQELDMDALDLVTNHRCGPHSRNNCHVQSAHFVPRID